MIIRKLRKKVSILRKKRKFRYFYKQYIKEGDLCFDIGANVGERSEIFSGLKAKVIAVEPVKESNNTLKQKFKNNKNVIVLSVAIGSVPGEREIYISNYLKVCTLSKEFIEKHQNQEKHDIRWDEVRHTGIKTLDQLITDYGLPTFCKIDVEGYELEVLKGLSQAIPLISFEYNIRLKKLALDCIKLLSKFNKPMHFNFSPYESMRFAFNSWRNEAAFYDFIEQLPENIETGDIYVRFK